MDVWGAWIERGAGMLCGSNVGGTRDLQVVLEGGVDDRMWGLMDGCWNGRGIGRSA
jgi:hypothetical protein